MGSFCVALAVAFAVTVQQTPPQPAPAAPPPMLRRSVPMPTQPQSLDYFAGTWTFKRLGAESPVAPGPGSGTLTFTMTADGTLQGVVEMMLEGAGSYREQTMVILDPATKRLSWSEQRPGGDKITGTGDWSSPIAIHLTLDPTKLNTGTYQIKRVISVISATSFRLTEEVSVNGGPFTRLGNALYMKQ